MPMYDNLLVLTKQQSLAGVASTYAYGQYEIDFEATSPIAGYPDKGAGSPLCVRFIVTTAFTVATYVQFGLCFDTTSQATSPSGLVAYVTCYVPLADLTLGGYIPELKIPDQHKRYMNLQMLTVGTPGAGAVTAFMDIATGLRHR
jgi:hypothetical protein